MGGNNPNRHLYGWSFYNRNRSEAAMQSILEIARENVMNNLEEQIIRDSMIVEEFHKLYYGDPQKTWQKYAL